MDLVFDDGSLATEPALESFLVRYGAATSTGDGATLAQCYDSSFFFSGPSGSQAVRTSDFLAVLPRMKAASEQLGVISTRLQSSRSKAINRTHALSQVVWRVTFRSSRGSEGHVSVTTTYLLVLEPSIRILGQIDHEDLMGEVKACLEKESQEVGPG